MSVVESIEVPTAALSGLTAYVDFGAPNGQSWDANTIALAEKGSDWADGHQTTTASDSTAIGGLGPTAKVYRFIVLSNLPTGDWNVTLRQQVGGSRSFSADGVLATGVLKWNATTGTEVTFTQNLSTTGVLLSAENVTGNVPANALQIGGQAAEVSGTGTITFTAGSTVSTYAGGAVASVTGGIGGSIAGDVQGRVLGGGSSTITGIGVRATDGSGNALATFSQVSALDNNTSTKIAIPDTMVVPTSGTTTYIAEVLVQGDNGQLIAPDATPTVAVVDEAGNNLSVNLVSGPTLVTTGQYKMSYAVAYNAANAQVRWTISYSVNSAPYVAEFTSSLIPYTPASFTGSDRTTLAGIATTLAGTLTVNGGTVTVGGYAGGQAPPAASAIASAVWQDTTAGDFAVNGSIGKFLATLSIPTAAQIATTVWQDVLTGADFQTANSIGSKLAALFSGMTSLPNWLRAMARNSTPDSTALSEINSGGGSYDATADSLEAIRQHGDAAWAVGAGGSAANQGVLQNAMITLIQGDDYEAADGRALDFESDQWTQFNWPSLSGGSVAFTAKRIAGGQLDINASAGSIVNAVDPARVRFQLTREQTAALIVGFSYTYSVTATLSDGDVVTLATGVVQVVGTASGN